MRLNSNVRIDPLREGINILKAWFSVLSSRTFSRPVSVNLLPSMECNSRCLMCDSWRIPSQDKALGTEDYKKLAKEIKILGVPYVTIGGGEPLLNKGLDAIISAFIAEGISVQITTNGYEADGKVCQRFAELGVSRLAFSIDTHQREEYRKIRGVDWFERVVKNIETAVRDHSKSFSVETNSVLSARNYEDFEETLKFLLGLGVAKACFSAVTVTEKNNLIVSRKGELDDISPEKLEALVKKLLSLKKKQPKRIAASTMFIKGLSEYMLNKGKAVYRCYAGFISMDILPNGDVYSCGNLPPYGNVRGNDIGEIWYSKEALKSRILMAKRSCPSCYTSCKIELALLADPLRGIPYIIEKAKELL